MTSSSLAAHRPPHLFASLNQRDRRLLFVCLAMVAVLVVVVALIAPQEEEGDTTPSSFSSESHGAKAAYLTLAESGYHMER
jgi:anti-sigma-K factor RskA